MQLATEQEARDAVKSDNVEDHRDNSDCVGQSERYYLISGRNNVICMSH